MKNKRIYSKLIIIIFVLILASIFPLNKVFASKPLETEEGQNNLWNSLVNDDRNR